MSRMTVKVIVNHKVSSPRGRKKIILGNFFVSKNCFNKGNISLPGREGSLGCLLHQTPKFNNNVFLFNSLTTLGTWILICWFITLCVSTFQPLILRYRRDNLVYFHWRRTITTIYHLPGALQNAFSLTIYRIV